jgi:hypothetical protein
MKKKTSGSHQVLALQKIEKNYSILKVILGKDYISKADKWLEFATQEGEFIPEQKKK